MYIKIILEKNMHFKKIHRYVFKIVSTLIIISSIASSQTFNITENKLKLKDFHYISNIGYSQIKNPLNEYFDPPGDTAECTTAACIDRELIKRSDDNENTVSNRLRTYEESTLPLLEYYKLKGVVKNVDAMKSINEVTSQINCIFNDL